MLPHSPQGHRLPIGIKGLPLPWTIAVLAATSLVASLIAARFAGIDGPWLWNYDSPTINFPLATFFHEALAQGSLPFWNDRIGLGFPLYADGQIGAFYLPNWLIYQLPPLQALDLSRIIHLTFAGIGTGLLVLRMTGSRLGGVTGVIVTVLCGGIVSKLAWTQALATFAWMPWIFLILVWRRPSATRWHIVGAAMVWGFQATAGHPPYWVLTGIAAAVIIISRSPDLRGLAAALVFGLVGVLVGAVQLVPTAVLTTLSFRAEGLDPAVLFRFSATPFDILGLAFANAFAPTGPPATDLTASWYPPGGVWALIEMYAFIGLPALAMATIGLTRRRARPLLLVAAVMVLIPIIGLFQPSIWAALPGLSGLRHPVRAYLLLDLALAISAGIGVARLRHVRDVRLPMLVVGTAVAAYAFTAIAVLLRPDAFEWVVGAIWPSGVNAAQVRQLAAQSIGASSPVALELIFGTLVLVVIARWRRSHVAQVVVVVLIALPLALLSPSFNQSLPARAFSLDDTALVASIRGLTPHRVLSLDVPFYGAYPDQSLDGFPDLYSFSALDLDASRQLLANVSAQPAGALTRATGVDTVVTFGRPCVAGVEAAYDRQFDAHICRVGGLTTPYWLPATAVVPPAVGSGSLISPVDVVANPDVAVAGAVRGAVGRRTDADGLYYVKAPADGYVFIDRAWWPGWQVSVDGVAVTPYRTWGGQLVPVSAGDRRIDQHLLPWDAILGAAITVGTLISIVVLAGIGSARSSSAARRARAAM